MNNSNPGAPASARPRRPASSRFASEVGERYSARCLLAAAAVALTISSAQGASSLDLSRYSVFGIYDLDIQRGAVSGLEASAVTYARDRGTLFFVGDEGTGVIEISRTGRSLGSMAFDWIGTGSTKHDTEGLAYLGAGILVVGEERLQDAYRFTYSAGGTAVLANSFVSTSNTAVGNNGMEGISFDPRGGGSYVSVKQQSPHDIRAGTLSFAAPSGTPPSLLGDGSSPPGGGISTMSSLFSASLMGLSTLSDVQTLASVDTLSGTAAADNLLVLSLGSRKLVEVTRTGTIASSFDLSQVLPDNAIEGVTIDEQGTIYLVAEQIQDGFASQLVVLAAPVPEPEAYLLMAAGLGFVVWSRRRRRGEARRVRLFAHAPSRPSS